MKKLGFGLLLLTVLGFLVNGIWLKKEKLGQITETIVAPTEMGNVEDFRNEKKYKSINCPEITDITSKTLQSVVNEKNNRLIEEEGGGKYMDDAIVLKKGEEIPYGPNTSYLNIYCNTIRNDNLVFSEEIYTEDYGAGAAHPNHRVWTLNFSVKTGKELFLIDLFKQNTDGLKNLTNKVVSKLKSDSGDALDNEISEMTDEKEFDFDLFLVESDGLRILFNQYAIAPSSSGLVEVKLNRADLGPDYLY